MLAVEIQFQYLLQSTKYYFVWWRAILIPNWNKISVVKYIWCPIMHCSDFVIQQSSFFMFWFPPKDKKILQFLLHYQYYQARYNCAIQCRPMCQWQCIRKCHRMDQLKWYEWPNLILQSFASMTEPGAWQTIPSYTNWQAGLINAWKHPKCSQFLMAVMARTGSIRSDQITIWLPNISIWTQILQRQPQFYDQYSCPPSWLVTSTNLIIPADVDLVASPWSGVL